MLYSMLQKISLLYCLLALTLFSRCHKIDDCYRQFSDNPTNTVDRVCFGSCSSQDKSQPILNTIVNKHPDLFIYLGDNIYGDTENMNILEKKYYNLCIKPEFINLISHVKTLAVWDDHDYGINDGGKEYPKKQASKERFMKFWGEENNTERNAHEGIYASYYWGDDAHRVQLILLDCRTFRDKLISDARGYAVNYDANSSMLGSTQWAWLKNELAKPAKIRIIGSSTQFSRTHNGYEAWANFPLEQDKMLQTIKDTKANGVVFISGDIHLGELSKLNSIGTYPIYDLTSSGLTQLEGTDIPNGNRIGASELNYNFGMIDIDWNDTADILLQLKIGTIEGDERNIETIHLNDLKF